MPEPARSDEAPSSGERLSEDEAQGSDEFLQSLVAAMRGVAEESRDANLADLRRSVDDRIAQLRASAAERAEELRRGSELELTATADWERAEMDRVKAEAERRVAAQQAELERQMAEHRTSSDREIEATRRHLADYERDLTSFFDQLSGIRDPAAFVAAAKRMPRGPDPLAAAAAQPASPAVADWGSPTPPPAPDASQADLAAQRASMVPMTQPAAPKPSGTEPAGTEPAGTEPAGTEPQGEVSAAPVAVEAVEAPVEAPVDSTNARLAERLAELDQRLARTRSNGDSARPMPAASSDAPTAESTDVPADAPTDAAPAEAAATAEAVEQEVAEPAVAGEDSGDASTPIMVKGLGSFGAITSFKQALERADGIHGVTLSLGPGGEFVYRANHAPGFDLVGAIRAIEGQGASIDEADGSLMVTINRGR
jgi:hypothetical protein